MKNYSKNLTKQFRMICLLLTIMVSSSVLTAQASPPAGSAAVCPSTVAETLPLKLDGEDDACYVTSGDISHINSWNMQLVEINGIDYTNRYSDDMPEMLDGKYHIRYVGLYPWSHLEIMGSSGGDASDHCSGPCNASAPVYPTVSNDGCTGNVTMYSTSSSNGGACNYGATDVMHYAAINAHVVPGDGMGNWQGGTACGQCAEVTVVTSQGPRQLVVRIMDKCPDAHCGIDLGGAAPGELMIDGFGRYQGQWRFVSCDGHPQVSDGPPTIDVFAGSNRWWSRVNVRNGTTGVDHIEWQNSDGSRQGIFPLAADPENTYEVPVNDVLHAQTATFLITVHYTDGTTAVATMNPTDLATPGSYPLN